MHAPAVAEQAMRCTHANGQYKYFVQSHASDVSQDADGHDKQLSLRGNYSQ